MTHGTNNASDDEYLLAKMPPKTVQGPHGRIGQPTLTPMKTSMRAEPGRDDVGKIFVDQCVISNPGGSPSVVRVRKAHDSAGGSPSQTDNNDDDNDGDDDCQSRLRIPLCVLDQSNANHTMDGCLISAVHRWGMSVVQDARIDVVVTSGRVTPSRFAPDQRGPHRVNNIHDINTRHDVHVVRRI